MTAPQNDYLSVFLLQSPALTIDSEKEYLLEARIAPLAPSWGFLGIPELVQTRKRGIEPRLATAIIQALNISETT
jgi:chemotaxis protein methyltransferase CheR